MGKCSRDNSILVVIAESRLMANLNFIYCLCGSRFRLESNGSAEIKFDGETAYSGINYGRRVVRKFNC